MRKDEVEIGMVYAVKVSGVVVPVKLVMKDYHQGWWGENLNTGRQVRIRTAARLRGVWGVKETPTI